MEANSEGHNDDLHNVSFAPFHVHISDLPQAFKKSITCIFLFGLCGPI